MKDLLGRELKDGDLCVGMAIGRDSHGMHLGIFKGSSICYLSKSVNRITGKKILHKSCTSNMYLIKNPTQEELVIKEEIQEFLDKEADEKQKKASIKTIPLGKLDVGGVYEDTNGRTYIYLGKRKVTINVKNSNYERIEEGNCFANIYYRPEDTEQVILDRVFYINPYSYNSNITILKGNKKLVNKVRQLNIEFPVCKTSQTSIFNEEITMKVE